MEIERRNASSSDGLSEGLQRMRSVNGRTTGPTRRSSKGQWTAEEDETLCQAVQRFNGKNWKKIAECFKDRTDVQCLHRWQKVLNPELVKGPWSKEEDEIIVQLVKQYGAKKWSAIAQHLPGRIGKQCRERWHNHLNPAINKDAWTQDEELALIRAHQIYGNKWAELTKFLPGRTDNSIKNHWNSSVKKKLDSYLASGLLEQFQGLPHVSHTNQSTPSRVQQCSGDDSIKDSQADEISECSQSSNFINCSQSTNEMGNSVRSTREECQLAEKSGHEKDPSSSPVSCSDNYYASVQEVAFTMSEACEVGPSSNFGDNRFSDNWVASSGKNWQLPSDEIPNLPSPDLNQQSGLLHSIGVNQRLEVLPFSSQTSVGLNATSMANIVIGPDVPENMLIYPENGSNSFASESLYKCPNSNKVDGPADLLLYQSPNCRNPHDGSLTSQSYYPQSLCFQSQVPLEEDTSMENQEEFLAFPQDGFYYTNNSSNSQFVDGQDNIGPQEEIDQEKESSKLVPADAFTSGQTYDIPKCPSVSESHVLSSEQQDTGALSYEPPRFPSLDIPFFSCDLIQPGKDMQHEYSPLGIRQHMMSSMNCFSPTRLWDSPSRDDSPKAVLKSAAKSFTGTPSILKKRLRDLVSPLSEKRCEKRLESTFSNLRKDFSRLEVMFEDSANVQPHLQSPSRHELTSGVSIEDKENLCSDGGKLLEHGDRTLHNRSSETSDTDTKAKDDAYYVDGIVRQSSGALMEQNLNDLLFFSPDNFGSKSDTPLGLSVISPRNISVSGKKAGSRLVVSSTPSASLPTPLEIKTQKAVNDAGLENISIFSENVFKRSFESPSAWKSPWFINSFVPGPRVDTDITIEDIGYFMSPGETSYDALGLMKQLSEHTASAFANAQEVLGDETPDSILRKRCSNIEKEDQTNNLPSTSDALTKGRVLDFSECGSPGKGTKRTESGRFSSTVTFSSPSSSLLKGFR